MIHSYDVEIAEKHGIVCAVLLYNIYHWIEKNKETGLNFHDDRYWTYDTTETLAKHFPEMSERTIQRAMKKLEDENLILKGNFNKSGFDRTIWYSLTDLAYSIMTICHHPFRQNGEMDSDKMTEAIPQCTTGDTHCTYKEIDKSISMPHSESVAQQIKKVLSEWNDMAYATGMAQVKRVPPESERYRMLKARLSEYGIEDVLDAIANVRAGGSYLSAQRWFDFGWFLKPNNFPKVLEGKYGKGKREKPKEDHPKPETKEIVKDDEYYNAMSAEEWIKYFEETYGNDDDKT